MHLAGLDIGFSPSRRSNALAVFRDGRLSIDKLNIDERNAALARLANVDVIAIDAPIVAFETRPDAIREVERIFCRGPFQKRCKPGFSHIEGTGQDLRAHGLAAARASMHATNDRGDAPFPRIIPGHNIVEAFPNAFLGVALADDEYAAQPELRRGGKFDWLYDRWVSTRRFHEAARLAGLPDTVAAAADSERDHDRRAAIVCLLTAAFAHNGTAEAIGDPLGGYFFLPPESMWAPWSRTGVTKAPLPRKEQRPGHSHKLKLVTKDEDDRLVDKLDALLEDYSLPEIIDALITLSRDYKEQLKAENNSEYEGWEGIEIELTRALKGIGGV